MCKDKVEAALCVECGDDVSSKPEHPDDELIYCDGCGDPLCAYCMSGRDRCDECKNKE